VKLPAHIRVSDTALLERCTLWVAIEKADAVIA
jgi:hypothetical protein